MYIFDTKVLISIVIQFNSAQIPYYQNFMYDVHNQIIRTKFSKGKFTWGRRVNCDDFAASNC